MAKLPPYEVVAKLSETGTGETYVATERETGKSHTLVARDNWTQPSHTGAEALEPKPMDGESLASHLQARGPLTDRQLVMIVNPLCAALERLRSAGLRVSVLRPEHIFLPGGLEAFSPKLMGSGLADFPTEKAPVDDRADVFALGALMYQASTGHPAPLDNAFQGEVAADSLQAIIRTCLSPPGERFLGPAEVAAALEHWIHRDAPAPIPLVEEVESEKEGSLVGNYQLIRLLGEGSMGRVFLAHHVKLGRPVALKILRGEHAQNRDLIQRFFLEARAVNQINHEHIVEVFDFVEEPSPRGHSRVYCVMELLPGQTLTAVLKQGALPIARVVRVIRQVCAALESAHQLGVIHRDIKPDNLFLVEGRETSDYIKVLDFGVAKLATPLPDTPASSTMAGMVIGTPMYMAPEQAAGLGTDARSDIYSLATVLYEMLAGHAPFDGGTAMQLMVKVLSDPVPQLPARTFGGERIPKALEALVRACLSKDPSARPASMEELSARLARFETYRAGAKRSVGRFALAVMGVLALMAAVLTLRPRAKVNTSAPPTVVTAVSTRPFVPDSASPKLSPPTNNRPPAHVAPSTRASKRTKAGGKSSSERMSRDAVLDPFAM